MKLETLILGGRLTNNMNMVWHQMAFDNFNIFVTA
jgi:hypothetical protein